MGDTIRFTTHADGSTTADCFPEKLCVADQAIENDDFPFLRRDGDRLYITPANGHATYLLTEEDAPHRRSWWARLYATIEEK